ncbi:TAF6-like RNA polymerase II p300/CBP-associated factor-associated factor 65 kDa subunit 6L isoform X4 [Dendrobates tinctorius]
MSHTEDRRYVELCQDSVRLSAESVGLEITDEVAALLAEDVCYRLREITQFSAQCLRHSRRRRLTVEDFNRALRWNNVEPIYGHGSPDPVSFRSVRDGDCHCAEDREINLVELALATNIPKGTAETAVRVHISYLDSKGNLEPQGTVPAAVSMLTDDLLKYYQRVTRAVLGDDLHLMKVALQDLQTNSKIGALLPYFVYVVSGVKSVSHDLEQLSRLLQLVRSLLSNPYLYLGSYGCSLMQSVLYCVTEPLAASINPLNDHWTLRDYGAGLLSCIWTHRDLEGSLYTQVLQSLQKVLGDPVRPLCSHYGAVVGLHALGWKAVEQVLYPLLPTYWAGLQTVLDDHSMSNAQVKADGHKVYGAILVLLGLRDGTVRVFNTEKSKFTEFHECRGGEGAFRGLGVLDNALVTCVESGLLKVWKEGSNENLEVQVGAAVEKMRLCDTQRHKVGTGGKENDLKIWDLQRPEEPIFRAKNVRNDWLDLRVPVWIRDLDFIPESDKIVTCTSHHQVRLYDPSSTQRRPVLEVLFGEDPLTALSITPDGRSVVVGNSHGHMGVIDLRKGRLLCALKGNAGSVRSIQCHKSMPVVASCGLDRFMRLHSLNDKKLLHKVYLKSRLNCLLLTSRDKWEGEELIPAEAEDVKDEEEDEVWNNMDTVMDKTNSKKRKDAQEPCVVAESTENAKKKKKKKV